MSQSTLDQCFSNFWCSRHTWDNFFLLHTKIAIGKSAPVLSIVICCINILNYREAERWCFDTNVNLGSLSKCSVTWLGLAWFG
jgi:hypothetical protein